MTFGRDEFFENEDAKADTKAAPPPVGRQFKPVRFEDITMSSDPPYLVQGLLPRDGLAVLWGPPKCGKSFWAFDVALHVALGREYRDRAVQQGTVIYIACEGERGLGARTEAFRQAKLGEDDDHNPPFWLLTTRLNLSGDIETLIADLKAAGITNVGVCQWASGGGARLTTASRSRPSRPARDGRA